MKKRCYDADELLSLGGDEAHLKECASCRDRFALRGSFFKDLLKADAELSRAARTNKARADGLVLVERLRPLSDAERVHEVRALPPSHPAFVVCFCEESKAHLLHSPNEAEDWLRLAETAFSLIPPSTDRWEKKEYAWAEAKVWATHGNLLMFRGEIQKAHTEFQRAVQAFDSMDDEFQTGLAGRSLAFTWTKLGNPLKAKEVCLRSLEILTAYGSDMERVSLLNNFALVHLALSDYQKANALFDHLLESAPPDHPYIHSIRRNAILPFLEMKDYDEARRRLESLTADLAATDLDVEKALTQFMKGEILLLTSDPSRAESEFRRALSIFIREGLLYDEAETRAMLGKACFDLGRFEEARGQLQMALAFYAGQGFAIELVKTLEDWTAAVEHRDLADRAFHVVRSFNRLTVPPSSLHPAPHH